VPSPTRARTSNLAETNGGGTADGSPALLLLDLPFLLLLSSLLPSLVPLVSEEREAEAVALEGTGPGAEGKGGSEEKG